MKKRLLTGLLAAALLLQTSYASAESHPLVYRVRDGEGRQIYLLGTIHVGNADMYPLGEAVEEAYRESDTLAVELDLYAYNGNIFSSLKYAFALLYGIGDDAEKHLSPETYALGVEKLGLPEMALKRMRPAMWYSLAENYMIASVGLEAMQGVDYSLLKRAHHDGKTICELEGLDEQMAAMLAIPEEVIDYEIQAMLTYPEESGQGLLNLFEAWRHGDEAALCSLLDAQGGEDAEELEEAYADYNDVLILSRNDGFERQAKEYLEKGEKALIAIGAFHIIGPDGLAQRLARAGYIVERVGE